MRVRPLLLCSLLVAACAKPQPEVAPSPATPPGPAPKAAVETVTVTVRDADADRKAFRAELRAIEKETQVAELQTLLADTRDEVVKTMSKLTSLASRAEAASGIAEAEVALGTLRGRAGAQHPDVTAVAKLVQQASVEFQKNNFGGAYYLATQARSEATTARTRLGDRGGPARAGENTFAVPIRIKVSSRGNVREGPATTFGVAFAVEAGAMLTAYAHTDDWVRITDDGGRSGWIFRTLVARP